LTDPVAKVDHACSEQVLTALFKELDALREEIEREQDPGRKQELTMRCRREQLTLNKQAKAPTPRHLDSSRPNT